MNKKLTRRQLVSAAAGSAAVSVVALTVIAQAPPSAQDFDKAAVQSHKENSDALAKFEIPMALEPAFQFKA
jgi:hypothetical protein